jgi:hypothetical protein
MEEIIAQVEAWREDAEHWSAVYANRSGSSSLILLATAESRLMAYEKVLDLLRR